jgi:hypothetical protein
VLGCPTREVTGSASAHDLASGRVAKDIRTAARNPAPCGIAICCDFTFDYSWPYQPRVNRPRLSPQCTRAGADIIERNTIAAVLGECCSAEDVRDNRAALLRLVLVRR